MSIACRILSTKYVFVFACAGLLGAALAQAQSVVNSPATSPASSNWSSSQSGQMQIAEGASPANPAAEGASALPAAPAPRQDQGGYSGWGGHDVMHRLTLEFGGGAVAPAANKNDITWGGQFLIGGGVNVTQNLAAFLEFQYLDNKIPGAVIAETGAQGGRYHIWSFTVDPLWDLFPKAANDVYLVGGGGFYRKTMNFTNPTQSCGFFYYYYTCGTSNQTVGSIGSNNGGWNIGGGYQHRFGGMYGLSRTRFFAQVRYVDVLSPAIRSKSLNGLAPVSISAGTKLLPITVGFRW